MYRIRISELVSAVGLSRTRLRPKSCLLNGEKLFVDDSRALLQNPEDLLRFTFRDLPKAQTASLYLPLTPQVPSAYWIIWSEGLSSLHSSGNFWRAFFCLRPLSKLAAFSVSSYMRQSNTRKWGMSFDTATAVGVTTWLMIWLSAVILHNSSVLQHWPNRRVKGRCDGNHHPCTFQVLDGCANFRNSSWDVVLSLIHYFPW